MSMQRVVRIHRLSDGSWKWDVYCDGQWVAGCVEETKRDAKRASNQFTCESISNGSLPSGTNIETIITPPQINASIENGVLSGFDIINPWTQAFHHFTTNDISENELAWIAGLCFYDSSLSQNYELLRAKLKTWDVYLGGNSMLEIMQIHNLTEVQCNLILSKNWITIDITKIIEDDETVHLDWIFMS